MSQGYLSLVGRSASSQEVQKFFREHNTSWSSVNVYKGRGVTEASLELYDSALEVAFIKKLSPKSSVTQQQQDFVVSSITLINHTDHSNQKVGQIIGPVRLTSRLSEVVQALGEHYEQNRYQGTYCWRKDGVIIEVDYETTSDEIGYIVMSADNAEIKAIKEVAESLSDGALSSEESEQLGIEPPDMQYQEEPTPSEYDNLPVIERDSGGRLGVMVLLAAVVVALFFFDDVSQAVKQLIEPLL
jgi:hypothetical protein